MSEAGPDAVIATRGDACVRGVSRWALGERLGMTIDVVEVLELGGMLPVVVGLLARLAGALVGAVNLHAGSTASMP